MGRNCLSNFQNCTAAMRMLTYYMAADLADEYNLLAPSTALKCLNRFCAVIFQCFRDGFLRPPNRRESKVLLQHAGCLRFPSFLLSIACCRWKWKKSSTAHDGQFNGKDKVPSLTLKEIADDRLYVWRACFGIAECNNDESVFKASTMVASIANGMYPLPCQ